MPAVVERMLSSQQRGSDWMKNRQGVFGSTPLLDHLLTAILTAGLRRRCGESSKSPVFTCGLHVLIQHYSDLILLQVRALRTSTRAATRYELSTWPYCCLITFIRFSVVHWPTITKPYHYSEVAGGGRAWWLDVAVQWRGGEY